MILQLNWPDDLEVSFANSTDTPRTWTNKHTVVVKQQWQATYYYGAMRGRLCAFVRRPSRPALGPPRTTG